jgi:hypothetical protein
MVDNQWCWCVVSALCVERNLWALLRWLRLHSRWRDWPAMLFFQLARTCVIPTALARVARTLSHKSRWYARRLFERNVLDG